MSQYDVNKVEELQMVLLKNPRSPVFAVLAEAYRKMGLLEEALEVTTKGIRHNPEYVSGLVAHAKVLYELKNYHQASEVLHKAHLLKPENILALRLLGHCFMKMKQQKEALKCFKKLLILKPDDEKVLQFIKKWEFLDNLPPSEDSTSLHLEGSDHWIKQLPSAEHVLHLIDSFMNYGDRENALDIAHQANLHWPGNPAIKQRQQMLLDSPEEESEESIQEENPALKFLNFKKEFYQQWLQRIELLKEIDPR